MWVSKKLCLLVDKQGRCSSARCTEHGRCHHTVSAAQRLADTALEKIEKSEIVAATTDSRT